MLKVYRDLGKVVIMWRGVPMLIPLRHVRPHVGFVWLLSSVFNFSTENNNGQGWYAGGNITTLQATDFILQRKTHVVHYINL